ncbi:hypothetical protein OAU13_00870 [bacterium]|nr:hypothetical protein [bacterium]
MSFYGSKQNGALFGVYKQKVDANTTGRFGGTHGILAYRIDNGASVDVTDHDSGVKLVAATDSDVDVVILMGLDLTTPATFNATLVSVDGSYNLAANTHGVVIGGLLNSLDGETDIHFIAPAESEVSVTGTGKLIALTYS